MSNTTVVPHLFGILRSSPFQQGVARHSQTRTALEEGNTTQTYSTSTVHVLVSKSRSLQNRGPYIQYYVDEDHDLAIHNVPIRKIYKYIFKINI